MRNAFAAQITQLAGEDERVVLMMGDIGNRLFDNYKELYPDRFLNCGVAEANMMSMAAGMALCGLRPVVYTIAPFVTTRCLEQIRVDVCYHRVPVIIIGVGSGLSYASLGATHHACEDIALLRALPHMAVVCPGDPIEVRLALSAALRHPEPVYVRLGKKGEPEVHQEEPEFQIGKGITIRDGRDVCVLSTGNVLPLALQVAEEFAGTGVSAQVVSFHTVKPLDEELLMVCFSRFRTVVTLEEHSVLGGLGGAVAEWLCERPALPGRLCRIGTPDTFMHEAGEQDYARKLFGLTPAAIVKRVMEQRTDGGPQ